MYSVNETVEANNGDPEVSWARPWPLFVPKLSTLSRSRRPQPSQFISAHPSPIVQTADLHQVTEAVLSTLSDSCMAHLRHDEVRMARPQLLPKGVITRRTLILRRSPVLIFLTPRRLPASRPAWRWTS